MIIYPAIDLFDSAAVRLYKGDYAQMTVYNDDPVSVARDFAKCGADHIHLVDLQGAKSGETENIDTIVKIKRETGLFCEIGGGVRNIDTIDKYAAAGLDRVILGTAAVTDERFVRSAVSNYGDLIAVGVDIKNGAVAIKGWTESSGIDAFDFCDKMQDIGVSTLIVTDISKDGALSGTNRELYRKLSDKYTMNIIASGGVSTIDDVAALSKLNIHGAIIGKAYYTGAIDLAQAIEVAK